MKLSRIDSWDTVLHSFPVCCWSYRRGKKIGRLFSAENVFKFPVSKKNRTEKTATLRKNGQRKGKKVLIRAEAQVSATPELSAKDAFFFGHFGDHARVDLGGGFRVHTHPAAP